jgi:hypothetical protein
MFGLVLEVSGVGLMPLEDGGYPPEPDVEEDRKVEVAAV